MKAVMKVSSWRPTTASRRDWSISTSTSAIGVRLIRLDQSALIEQLLIHAIEALDLLRRQNRLRRFVLRLRHAPARGLARRLLDGLLRLRRLQLRGRDGLDLRLG